MARRDGNRVRSFTRRGYDWSGKYPWIVEALRCLWVRSIIVDGEAVWAGEDGKSDFDRLHSHGHDHQIFLYAFDLLELNGEDYRSHPLEKRKNKIRKASRADSTGDAVLGTPRPGWRDNFRASLQNGIGRHRLESARFPLSKRAN
jgi:bifunctional non-homologous end joining protein LigD